MDYDLGTLQSEDLRESNNAMIENGYDMYYSKLSASFQMPKRINEFECNVFAYVINKTQFLGTKKIHSESSLQEYLEMFPDAVFVFKMRQDSTQKHVGYQCKAAMSNGSRCQKIVSFNQSIKGQFCPECSKSSDRIHDYFFM